MKLKIKVVPNAKMSQIAGWRGEELKIKIAAPPVAGQANWELIRFLAEEFWLNKNQVEILHGQTSRNKLVEIKDFSLDKIFAKYPRQNHLNL